MMQLGTPAGLV